MELLTVPEKNQVFFGRKMKKGILLVVILLVYFPVFTGGFNDYESILFQQIMDFQFNAKKITDKNEAVVAYDEYWQQLKSDEVQSSISYEMSNIIENIFITAKNDILTQINPDSEEMKEQILAQYEKISKQQDEVPISERNPYLVISSSDLTTAAMKYLPKSQIMKLMKQGQGIYEEVIEVYPTFSPVLFNLGIIAYMTPQILGGNKQKGIKYMEDAFINATYDLERYDCSILYSQVLYEEKDYEKAREVLSVAKKLLPEDETVLLIIRLNDAGYSLFEYMTHKDKIDKKLKKQS